MKASVYIETSVISYHEAQTSRDLVVAARQTITQEWWHESKQLFDIYISVLVVEEAKSGDVVAAEKRLSLIKQIPVLEVNSDAESLASMLLDKKLLPENSAEMKTKIVTAIEEWGFESPAVYGG